MVKFLKPNKVVLLLQGRYAGRKAVIVKNFDDGVSGRQYGHALVAGIAGSTPEGENLRASRLLPATHPAPLGPSCLAALPGSAEAGPGAGPGHSTNMRQGLCVCSASLPPAEQRKPWRRLDTGRRGRFHEAPGGCSPGPWVLAALGRCGDAPALRPAMGARAMGTPRPSVQACQRCARSPLACLASGRIARGCGHLISRDVAQVSAAD